MRVTHPQTSSGGRVGVYGQVQNDGVGIPGGGVRSRSDALLVVTPVRSPMGAALDAVIEASNAEAAALAGRAAGTLDGLLVSEVFPEGRRQLLAWITAALRPDGGGDAWGALRCPGGVRVVECRISVLDERLAVTLRDEAQVDQAASAAASMRDLAPADVMVLESVRDPGGRLVDVVVADLNAAAAASLGVPADRAMGRPLSGLVAPGRLAALLRRHERVVAGGAEVEVEEEHDGRWLVSRLTPLGDAVAVITRDETEHRRADVLARELAEQFRFVASAATDMIALHEPDGTFRFVSDACTPLLGRGPAELVGRKPEDVLGSVTAADIRRLLRGLAMGMTWAASPSVRTTRADGTDTTLDVRMSALRGPSGRVTGYISVSRDAAATLAGERHAASEVAQQRALREAATSAARSDGNLAAVADGVVGQVAALLDVGVSALVRFDASPSEGRVVVAVGPDSALAAGDVLTRALRPVPSSAGGVPVDAQALVRGAGRRDAMAAAVMVDGVPWGALVVVMREGRTPAPGTARTLERFAELAAVAVGSLRSRARLAAQAVRDPLTGLPNHRAFHEALRSEAARALRHHRPLALALFDVDHFRRVNEVHGHRGGDAILAEVAERLRGNVRDGEMLARTGGEQFAWILVETSAEQAMAAVERSRSAVAARPVHGGAHVTLSAGVCDLSRAGGADELFRLAEGALYWAKSTGRDRMVLYERETVAALSAEERAERLERSQALVALRSLARAVDAKDPSTHAHSERVSGMCERIALRLGWTADAAAQLAEAALLHDVGKIGVPDAVLLNPGRLSDAEYEVVQRHAALGAQIADEALSARQCSWIRGHHERWDGTGYPDGLRGEHIPDGARIIAVADAWDVMTRARHYGSIRDEVDALRELCAHSGSQFWPEAVTVFQALQAESDISG